MTYLIETVKRFYDALGRGDMPSLTTLLTSDITCKYDRGPPNFNWSGLGVFYRVRSEKTSSYLHQSGGEHERHAGEAQDRDT
jgi:hypothetical protein